MQTRHWIATALGVAIFMGSMSLVYADGGSKKGSSVGVVTNPLYAEECGACHFAYQPGLLPEKSWRNLMGGLADHFGDNAELPPGDQAEITAYLAENAADRVDNKRSARIMRSLAKKGIDAPQRISDIPFIRHEHNEIPRRKLADNPEVKTIANCNACHTRAAEGYYNEHDVVIPGFGRKRD
ncbi:MAG: diheme cytochrome c [Nitrospirota bacterium]|nr:diheme cytochrome c [Nitrospirota bacterium]